MIGPLSYCKDFYMYYHAIKLFISYLIIEGLSYYKKVLGIEVLSCYYICD